MDVQFFAPNPLDEEIHLVLQALDDRAAGRGGSGRLERHRVDLKEEAGRRGPRGEVLPGAAQNEKAAKVLAEEVACMANTPGGGALIVGVADDGILIGTALNTEWLRHRLYELTERRVTTDAREVSVAGVRLLVLRLAEAIELVRVGGRTRWRVDDHCVEVDPTTWHRRHLDRTGFDWSAQPSTHRVRDARATALQVARDYLRGSNDAKALDLMTASDADLLRRLNTVTDDGYLTNAGALVFVGRPTAALDYLRRDVAGGDSRIRINEAGRGLLEELDAIERAVAAYNQVEHVGDGFAIGQVPRLPANAVREAIVNGLAHRDWHTPRPTAVEHVGNSVVVYSPGGFIGNITPANIITHPSQSRNTSLTALLAALRVAEREGIGVDRMVRDMIRLGLEPPVIAETDGPMVRIALVGGSADREWLQFLSVITPAEATDDLDVLVVLRELAEHGWVDAAIAAPILQRDVVEAATAIGRLADARYLGRNLASLAELLATPTQIQHAAGKRLIERIDGTPPDAAPAWCWTADALQRLGRRGEALRTLAGRRSVATRYAAHRRRISSTELASITGVAIQHARRTLKDLEDEGILAAGRTERAGRGFFYQPA